MWEHSHQAKMEMAFNLMCGNLKCPLDSFLSDDEAVIFLNYKIYFFLYFRWSIWNLKTYFIEI